MATTQPTDDDDTDTIVPTITNGKMTKYISHLYFGLTLIPRVLIYGAVAFVKTSIANLEAAIKRYSIAVEAARNKNWTRAAIYTASGTLRVGFVVSDALLTVVSAKAIATAATKEHATRLALTRAVAIASLPMIIVFSASYYLWKIGEKMRTGELQQTLAERTMEMDATDIDVESPDEE